MSENRRPGRPKRNFVVIKIYGPILLRDYLDTVQKVQGLADRSEAGRLVLNDAMEHGRHLGGATIEQ